MICQQATERLLAARTDALTSLLDAAHLREPLSQPNLIRIKKELELNNEACTEGLVTLMASLGFPACQAVPYG